MKIKVGVIFGGRSVEHEVSIISAIQTINAIDKEKYDVIPLYISKEGTWYTGDRLNDIENFRDMDGLLAKCKKILLSINAGYNFLYGLPEKKSVFNIFEKQIVNTIDVAFPVIHGTHGEDGALQGLLELLNIPYVGCDILSSAMGMDKIMTQALLDKHNLPVVKSRWFYSRNWIKENEKIKKKISDELNFPVVVKPSNIGSSIGVKMANNQDELDDAVEIAINFSKKILVEEAITNLREINCSVLGDYENVEVSVCEEPIRSSDFLSFSDKYITGKNSKGMSGAKRELPANISENMSSEIKELAKKTFLLLDCCGVARIDFFIDNDKNKIFINEINTIPGSLSFYLWEATGKSFTELTSQLIQLALKRNREKNNLIFTYESNILAGFKGIKGMKAMK